MARYRAVIEFDCVPYCDVTMHLLSNKLTGGLDTIFASSFNNVSNTIVYSLQKVVVTENEAIKRIKDLLDNKDVPDLKRTIQTIINTIEKN